MVKIRDVSIRYGLELQECLAESYDMQCYMAWFSGLNLSLTAKLGPYSLIESFWIAMKEGVNLTQIKTSEKEEGLFMICLLLNSFDHIWTTISHAPQP